MKNGADNFTAERIAKLRKNIDFSNISEIETFSDGHLRNCKDSFFVDVFAKDKTAKSNYLSPYNALHQIQLIRYWQNTTKIPILQFKLKISLLILILPFLFIFCFAENKTLKTILENNEYEYISGGTELKDINFLVLGKEKFLGDKIVVIFDKKYKVKTFLQYNCPRSYQPVFISENYIVIGFNRNNETGSKNLILYDNKQNEFRYIDIDYHLIWNLFIYKDNLFYSSEMANPHLNVVNLITGAQSHFDDYYCPYAEFGEVNGVVYACYDNKDYFIFENNRFIKTITPVPNFIPEFHDMNDYKIEELILQKLKY